MEVENHQGFTIKSEPGSSSGAHRVQWFHVERDEKGVFDVQMKVSFRYAASAQREASQDLARLSSELASAYGHRWVHGLIDLGRFEQGRVYNEDRLSDWTPLFAEDEIDDEALRVELLQALRRMARAQERTSTILSIDVDGISEVLGIDPYRTRGVLNELIMEGLAEGYAETFGHTATEGACRITGAGIRALRAAQLTAPERSETAATSSEATKPIGDANESSRYEYDLALSFAGPQRELAESLATIVRAAGFRVFYDRFYPADLWGEDLPTFFDNVYRKKSRYCVIFVSREYAERMWTMHERQSAVARSLKERGRGYILPVIVEPAELPGIPPTVGHLSLENESIEEISQILLRKLAGDSA